MPSDYTDLFQDPDAAEKYAEETFRAETFDSIVSRRQRLWLRGFTDTVFDTPPVHHDFGCGTGRVARMLDGLVERSHGYDTSHAMLAQARSIGTPGVLHLVEQDGLLPEATDPSNPVLVTVFRLLLNASDEVRDRAIEFAASMLPDQEAGLLVCENHGRRPSLRWLRKMAGRTGDWFNELGDRDVAELLERHGFELVCRQGFSMFSRGYYQRAPLSWVVPALDERLAHLRPAGAVATNALYVARRR